MNIQHSPLREHPQDTRRANEILIIDLNNFSRYPTIAVGYLASGLRSAGRSVTVLSPLAHGVSGVIREPAETSILNLQRRANYALAQTPGRVATKARAALQRARQVQERRGYPDPQEILNGVDLGSYDAVLVSTYLMYHSVCVDIGVRCKEAGTPLLIGGSYFAEQEVARSWVNIPGLAALVGGEVEAEISGIVDAVVRNEDLRQIPGLWLPDGHGTTRAPNAMLDNVPFPDYSDFPWDKYPDRLIPMITGRGCGWGACTFCSDITSTAGRTFRSRSPGNVLDEAQLQSTLYRTSKFVFTDLKLNSNLDVWQAILKHLPDCASGTQWIGSVHVESGGPNGLDRINLRRAAESGCMRLTTGLESGSQRILDSLAKGTDLAATSRFLQDSHAAGISNRVTMIHGAPGETACDVDQSTQFLTEHRGVIDRVNLGRFQLMIGPTILRRHDEDPKRFADMIVTDRDPLMATAEHQMARKDLRAYMMATQRLLKAVHHINRKDLPERSRAFDGVM